MILDTSEVNARIESPLNLLNRLRKLDEKKATSLVLPAPKERIESPKIEDLIENVDNKINGGRAYTNALAVLAESTEILRGRVNEIESPKELSRISGDMSRIVSSFAEKKDNANQTVVIFKPIYHNESHYETINVSE